MILISGVNASAISGGYADKISKMEAILSIDRLMKAGIVEINKSTGEVQLKKALVDVLSQVAGNQVSETAVIASGSCYSTVGYTGAIT